MSKINCRGGFLSDSVRNPVGGASTGRRGQILARSNNLKAILSKALLIIVGQVLGFVVLLLGPFSVTCHGQVVATWTDSSGNWSNSANWSTLTVPNNGGGKTYDVVINGTGADTVAFDATGTVINTLTLGPGETFQDNGLAPILTVGNVASPTVTSMVNNGTFNWTSGSRLISFGDTLNTGTMNLTDSSVSLTRGLDNRGELNLSSGSLATVGGLDSSGRVVISNSNVNLNGALLLVDGENASGDLSGSLLNGDVFVTATATMGINKSTITGSVTATDTDSLGISDTTIGGDLNIEEGPEPTFGSTGGVVNVKGEIKVRGSSADFVSTAVLTVGGAVSGEGNQFGGKSHIDIVGGSVKAESLRGGVDSVIDLDNATLTTGTVTNEGNGVINFGERSSARVSGDFTNSEEGLVTLAGTLTVGGQLRNGGMITISGPAAINSYKQSGGSTMIESSGIISGISFEATGGTVTVNGTLDPTAVEIGSRATLQGTGKIVGNVAMSGTMIPGGPGAPGTVTIFGNYEQAGNGILREFISSSSNGLLSVSGDVALDSDSILSITLIGGFNPLGDTFTIMDYASLVGQFSNGSSFWDDGFLWDVNYGANQIGISAVRSPEPSSLLLLCIGFAVLALCAQRRMAKTPLLS